jgi:TonB family protein
MTTARTWYLKVLVVGLGACLLNGQQRPVLDDEIKPVHFEPLNYPLSARLTHTQGIVVVRVTLDAKGSVISSDAVSGAKRLIPDAVANAKSWKFEPNQNAAAIIVYDFRIEGLCQLPCPSHSTFRPPNEEKITMGEPVVDHQ